MKTEMTLSALTLENGSAVLESYDKGFVPVVRDLVSKVVCFDQVKEEEYAIDKTKLKAIFKDGDVAFLPENLNLSSEFDFNRLHGAQRKWLETLDNDDKRLLIPLIAIYLMDCPKTSALIEKMTAAENIDVEKLMNTFSVSKPYSMFGQFHPLKTAYHYTEKKWTINFFGQQFSWSFETMYNAFCELFYRAMFQPIEDLSDIEIMAYYRVKGYVLKLEPEYNVWKLHEMHSTKTLMLNYETNVRDFQLITQRLDDFISSDSFFLPGVSSPYQHKEFSLKAFTIPAGSIAIKSFFTLENSEHYYVHHDIGQRVCLQKLDYVGFTLASGELKDIARFLKDEPFEVARKAISYVIPQREGTYCSARFIPFGIDSNLDCSFDALNHQENEYFNSLSEQEQLQTACLYLLSPFNRANQNAFVQAQKENDLEAIISLLHNKRDLEDNNRFVNYNKSDITYSPNKQTKAKYKYKVIAEMIFSMIHNAKTLAPTEMSLPELQLHYTLLGNYVLEAYPNNFMVLRSTSNILNHAAFHSHKQSPTEVEKLLARLQRD